MNREVKVAVISRADRSGGGASAVADDLYKGLNGQHNLRLARFVGEHGANDLEIPYGDIVSRRRSAYRIARRISGILGYVDHFSNELIGIDKDILGSDIVHAHDISSVMAPSSLNRLAKRNRRIIWTMHDMSPITGGCIYPLGCDGWEKNCGACPQLRRWPLLTGRDKTPLLHEARIAAISMRKIQLVSPSSWLANQVKRFVPDADVRVIPNGVDTDGFKPREFGEADLGDNVPSLIFVSNHIHETRKGGLYLSEIQEYLQTKDRKLRLLLVGNSPKIGKELRGNLELNYYGPVRERQKLSSLYASALGLLLPTHADNFPLVMLEMLSAGRPVFGFDTGGIAEAVDHSCGVIARPGHIGDLLNGFFAAYDEGRLAGMGRAARQRTLERYSMDKFLSAHRDLYLSISTGRQRL
jgi:glycosyltransferase involved in cell wall biosynthesis